MGRHHASFGRSSASRVAVTHAITVWCSWGIKLGLHPASFGRSSPQVEDTYPITAGCNLGIHLVCHPGSFGRSSALRVVATRMQLHYGAALAFSWAATSRPLGVPAPWAVVVPHAIKLRCNLDIHLGLHPASFGRSSAPRVGDTHAITVWCNLGMHLGRHSASFGRSSAPRVVVAGTQSHNSSLGKH